jgi:hypothetical protein
MTSNTNAGVNAGIAAGVAGGVEFPVAGDGRRSTSAFGRQVIADALRGTDAAGSQGAEQEPNWRSGYLTHFRRVIEAGLPSRQHALTIAADGLGSLRGRMRSVLPGGGESELDDLLTLTARHRLRTETVAGTAEPERELALPYRGDRLRGADLARQLDAWVAAGIIEPSCAEAVSTVSGHPDWLSLPGRTVAVLGAGAEIGPLPVLLRWGVTVAGVDLPDARIWDRVLRAARSGAGTLVVPVAGPAGTGSAGGGDGSRPVAPSALEDRAGADVTTEVPEIADWLAVLGGPAGGGDATGVAGPLVLGNYVYADGAANVRLCAAADTLTLRLQGARDDVALAFLATPTDVFAVPGDAVAHSVRAYKSRPAVVKLAGQPLRALSGGRLMRPAYPPGADPGISDNLVAQQGPNYALAKRLQRWRASLARDGGTVVSLNVAPPTRTRSVMKNRALAAAYVGAHRFGAEMFEPDTTRVLMAALLVHDLHAELPAHEHPWQDEAYAAAHGGLWRIGYAPRSVLGLAALLGYPASRRT